MVFTSATTWPEYPLQLQADRSWFPYKHKNTWLESLQSYRDPGFLPIRLFPCQLPSRRARSKAPAQQLRQGSVLVEAAETAAAAREIGVPQTHLWGSPPGFPGAVAHQAYGVALLRRCTSSFRHHLQRYGGMCGTVRDRKCRNMSVQGA